VSGKDARRYELIALAKRFLVEAIDALREEHVIPTPWHNPYVRVGRDYFGDTIRGLPSCSALEEALEAAYAPRFDYPPEQRYAQFAHTFMFSLIEATVARCASDQDFGPASRGVTVSIEEMLAVLDASEYEVVCCRAVGDLTTMTGERLELGTVAVIAGINNAGGNQEITRIIPTAPTALGPEPFGSFDPPHSLVIARELTASDGDPYETGRELSRTIERFLLELRLATGATVTSHYEVVGTTTLVSAMSAYRTSFLQGERPVRRPGQVAANDAEPLAALGSMLDRVEVKRAGMVLTSFDVAVRKFHASYGYGSELDHLVDVATGLEAALASGASDNEGLTLRLRNRAATLLSTAGDPATTIFADVGLLYKLRSRLVHGGQMSRKDFHKTLARISTVSSLIVERMPGVAVGFAVDRMRDLLRRAILARLGLAAGSDPPWPFSDDEVSVDALLADDPIRSQWRASWREQIAAAGAVQAIEPAVPAIDFLKAMSSAREQAPNA
jgi:hypothetical protein